MIMHYAGHLIIWPIFLLIFLKSALGQQYSYTRDCIDQHHKEIQCNVQLVDCYDETPFSKSRNNSKLRIGEAHDVRIEPFSKSLGNSYQLSVDISWQTPPNNYTKFLEGFFLDIQSDDQKSHICFIFNVSGSNWTSEAILSSPRLHFSTDNLFRFGQKYDVLVHTLPENPKNPRVARKEVVMPQNPKATNLTNILSPNCSRYSHPHASKWTAGFRRIILHPLARKIQIEFVGAPAQYCFEQYEVRLLDETGLELMHSDVINVDQMQTERIENNTIYFGKYNFTNLDLDINYIPSVIAVERASDGRCLCPVHGTNPYDNGVVCSCIAADWKAVKLQKIETDDDVVTNSTTAMRTPETSDSNGWEVYLIFVGIVFFILTCLALLLITAYRHYGACGKSFRIRFIQDRPSLHPVYDGAQEMALLENTAGESAIKVNLSDNSNLLIVYSHDSKEHAEAVLALADLLRDVFEFDVHLDIYDEKKIERNLLDYLSASILNADKILLINSIGAAQRYQAKIESLSGPSFVIEHNEPNPLDSLFVQQIDMVLQRNNIISARFDFSESNEVIMPMDGYLHYVIPRNLGQLISSLKSTNVKNDARLTESNPAFKRLTDAVEAQKNIVMSNPMWFVQTHHRRNVIARPSNIKIMEQMKLLPSISTEDEKEAQSIDVNAKVIIQNVPTNFNHNTVKNDTGDSGVYEESPTLNDDLDRSLQNPKVEDEKIREETIDSGMISDVEISIM